MNNTATFSTVHHIIPKICGDRVLTNIHLALCQANFNEFNNTGYDAMQDIVENDHELYLWWR